MSYLIISAILCIIVSKLGNTCNSLKSVNYCKDYSLKHSLETDKYCTGPNKYLRYITKIYK